MNKQARATDSNQDSVEPIRACTCLPKTVESAKPERNEP